MLVRLSPPTLGFSFLLTSDLLDIDSLLELISPQYYFSPTEHEEIMLNVRS